MKVENAEEIFFTELKDLKVVRIFYEFTIEGSFLGILQGPMLFAIADQAQNLTGRSPQERCG